MTRAAGKYPQSSEVLALYERLLERYGPRHWWPSVYGGEFEVICGAILVQNTAWRNVVRALEQMREAGLWSFAALHRASEEEVARAVRPSGYFNTKAQKLKAFARLVVVEFEGDLAKLLALETFELRDRLLRVWGVGEETADDIVLYAAKKPVFVIDMYTRRLMARLGWKAHGDRYEDYQQFFMSRLPEDAALYNEFHALIDHHCARVCKKTPLCGECVLVEVCPTGKENLSGAGS